MNYYLGIDIGTSATKALLMDGQGRAVAADLPLISHALGPAGAMCPGRA